MTTTDNPAVDPYDYVVWLDGEMTGLNYRDDLILELAVQVTTEADPLTVVDGWQSLVAGWVRPWPENIHPVVQQMHTDNGLFAEVEQARHLSGYREQDVAEALAAFTARWKGARLGGDGQHFDWRWIGHQWGDHVLAPLHYRQIDVSQMHQFWKKVEADTGRTGLVYEPDPGEKDLHRALSDVVAARHMYAHYRDLVRGLVADAGAGVPAAREVLS